jgi:Protein of unknown function (DUF1573)
MNTQASTLHHKNLVSRKFALLTFLALATALLGADQRAPAPITPAPAAVQSSPLIAPPVTLPASFLAWDADSKNYDAKPGEFSARFTCYVTNVSSEAVVVRELKASCGCTVAKLPAQPWIMSPGTNGAIVATIDITGKVGLLTKTLTVESSAGSKTLLLKVNIPPAPAASAPATVSNVRAELPKATAAQ